MAENEKFILDACCGSRMFWFDKAHPNAVYMDNRELDETLCDGRRIVVKPDVIGDFRHMPFADGTFRLVVFDPPHLKGKPLTAARRTEQMKKHGCLNRNTWKDDIRAGFQECFRVLIPCGVLVFKWNEYQIPIRQVIPLAPERPLFGQRGGKTHWLVFVKPLFNHKPKGIQ
ncbi:MAG: SAM-dependent methyltransferase [Lentisphaeria bacterium]|nr:SAM-dependent methyltransferase [Lentisphaeria bacterium]